MDVIDKSYSFDDLTHFRYAARFFHLLATEHVGAKEVMSGGQFQGIFSA